MKINQERALYATLAFLSYCLVAFFLYTHMWDSTLTLIVCLPHTIAYILAYGSGEFFFDLVLFFEALLIWYISYLLISALPKK